MAKNILQKKISKKERLRQELEMERFDRIMQVVVFTVLSVSIGLLIYKFLNL